VTASRIDDLSKSFARHLRAEGASDRTLVLYGQSIVFFSRWLEAQGRAATIDEFTRGAIREWLAQLADVNEPATVKLRYRGLFRFGGWLVDEAEIPEHPMKSLSPPQPKAKPVPVLTDADLAALMKACSGKEFNDRRDEAMIRLLLDCGLRISELCGLTVAGLDLDTAMAIVIGKGNKARPIYFSAGATSSPSTTGPSPPPPARRSSCKSTAPTTTRSSTPTGGGPAA
jgi:site-specific recombinase XerD